MVELKVENPTPEGLGELQARFAIHLLNNDLVKFGDFKHNIHRDHPEAPPSPVYLEIRSIRSLFNTKKLSVDLMQETIKPLKFEMLADVPTAVTPLVSTLSDRLEIPHITPRPDKNQIDGFVRMLEGRTAILFDDLVSGGGSILKVLELLEKFAIKVRDIFVFVDRQHGGKQILEEKGYKLHAAMTLSQMLDLYLRKGRIKEDLYRETNEKLAKLTEFYQSLC